MYWYIQGYEYSGLVILYLPGTFIFLWVIKYFNIRDFWPLVLASSLYTIFIESMLSGAIMRDFWSIFYSLGWHSALAVMVGWFYHQHELRTGNLRRLALTSSLLGFVLGLWATVFWLPEFGPSSVLNTPPFTPGQWSVVDYALLLSYLGVIYVLSQYLLGKFWDAEFHPSRLESGAVLAFLIYLMARQFYHFVLSVMIPLGVYAVVLAGLYYYSDNRKDESNYFTEFATSSVRFIDTLVLLLIPLFAVLAYSLMYLLNPSHLFIRLYIYNVFRSVQFVIGLVFFFYPFWWIFRYQKM